MIVAIAAIALIALSAAKVISDSWVDNRLTLTAHADYRHSSTDVAPTVTALSRSFVQVDQGDKH